MVKTSLKNIIKGIATKNRVDIATKIVETSLQKCREGI